MEPLFESSATERAFVIRSGDGRYVRHRWASDDSDLVAELTDDLGIATIYDDPTGAHRDRKACGMADKWDLHVVQIEIEDKRIARLV